MELVEVRPIFKPAVFFNDFKSISGISELPEIITLQDETYPAIFGAFYKKNMVGFIPCLMPKTPDEMGAEIYGIYVLDSDNYNPYNVKTELLRRAEEYMGTETDRCFTQLFTEKDFFIKNGFITVGNVCKKQLFGYMPNVTPIFSKYSKNRQPCETVLNKHLFRMRLGGHYKQEQEKLQNKFSAAIDQGKAVYIQWNYAKDQPFPQKIQIDDCIYGNDTKGKSTCYNPKPIIPFLGVSHVR